jgi:site-specific recombinase XerD
MAGEIIMLTPKFQTHFAVSMNQFIALRRLSGTDYDSQLKLLLYFDQFLSNMTYQEEFITPQIIEQYLQFIAYLHPKTQQNRLSVVRQFCQYLVLIKPHSYIPEPFHYPYHQSYRIPYIYTSDQITKILDAAKKLRPKGSIRPNSYRMFIGLLYSTGLRLSEAINLNLNDLDLSSQLLYIRRGKFHKDRWVPLSVTTTEKLRIYLQKRRKTHPRGPDAPVFINLKQRRVTQGTVYYTFRILLNQCHLRKPKGPGPRIHDLRHSFAVHRLLQWYRQGKDLNACLPALATYMGHIDIRSTQLYIHATSELLEQANQRFHSFACQTIKS